MIEPDNIDLPTRSELAEVKGKTLEVAAAHNKLRRDFDELKTEISGPAAEVARILEAASAYDQIEIHSPTEIKSSGYGHDPGKVGWIVKVGRGGTPLTVVNNTTVAPRGGELAPGEFTAQIASLGGLGHSSGEFVIDDNQDWSLAPGARIAIRRLDS